MRQHQLFFFLLLVFLAQSIVESGNKVHRRHRCVDDCSKSICGTDICSRCTSSSEDNHKAEAGALSREQLGE